ncbi:fimbrial protein FimV [Rhodanobacter sp. C06]|uniref:FimV/HubP family polar landmark protein n=1 Tax=Rhodanobacter sp. C06 TaxID=1945854 RepID=UPI0009875467|nr:FimV/HubP family polar landmark protein [Rhodanobacter sp. C06]OOG43131.1 fimbrial protein FimV [Rhodanobacter sp. C06]
MNRSLKLPLLVALALGSGHALALDLGQIQVKSALGQPLLAEIPVQKATPAELQQLNVQLASGEEFARAGVAGGRPTIPLRFDVVDGGNGHKVIRITSDAAVNDPFLDLLIEIHGGSGKSVREYTILLDPPGNSSAPTRVASRPSARAGRSAAAAPAAREATHAGSGEQVANGRFGPVERGQTLSVVAHQTAPAGVDLNQMLLALKQANPDAFYRDNINALKAGAVLRIPDKAAAEAVAVAAAAAEVRRQNGDWRSGTVSSSPVSVADAGTRATTSSSPSGAAASAGDHLALVPAKQGGKAAPTASGSDKSNALRQDLLRNQEAMANLQQQGEDLKSRLKDLNDINSKNERLLALKDNEIAELQQKLAAARKAAGQPAEPAHAATAGVSMAAAAAGANASKPAEQPASAASAPAAGSEAAAATAASTAKAEAPAAASTAPAASKPAATPASTTPIKPTVIKPAAPVAGEEPWYTQLWAQALGAAVIVLLLLGALLGRRRKAKPAAASSKLAPSLADRFGDAAPADGGDDVDQNMLLDQLAEHPDDIGLHLELVSLYYGRRDVERFEAAAEAMHAHVTDPQQEEWQDVVHMGEDLVPGHPLFAGHDSLSSDEVEAHHGFDIDRYAAEPVAAPVSAPASAGPPPLPANPVKVSEYNFNFDLTPAHESASKRTDGAEPTATHHAADEDATVLRETASNWHFDEPEVQAAGHDIEPREFSDDPADTKLDLARAYLDMGDPDGARAMLEEVLHEGSQTQRDVAKRMLDDLH